ncbi:MAG: hypothetical protein KDC37_06280, partial [Flavobacteriales bacterium]|nr:hypothetical protein [Flavobacteriales bacterium]
RVLTSVGVVNNEHAPTSMLASWKYNPAAFVILCESMDGTKAYAGARVHALGGNQDLPWIEGTAEIDPKNRNYVEELAPVGTGELCGMWNSMEVANMGFAVVYIIRSAVAVISQLGLKTMWALCSPYSARIASRFGFHVYEKVGDKGLFWYPTEKMVATTTLLLDSNNLDAATDEERRHIFNLRDNWKQTRMEEHRNHKVEIAYALEIANIDKNEFRWVPEYLLL